MDLSLCVSKLRQPCGGEISSLVVNQYSEIAFFRQCTDGYESDERQLYTASLTGRSDGTVRLSNCIAVDGPRGTHHAVQWSHDGQSLDLFSEHSGKLVVHALRAHGGVERQRNSNIEDVETGKSIHYLSGAHDGRGWKIVESSSLSPPTLRISANGLGEHTLAKVINHTPRWIQTTLSRYENQDFWYTGAANRRVHGYLTKPVEIDDTRSYPVLLMIHGGPQQSWTDSWSQAWNPAVYTEAG